MLGEQPSTQPMAAAPPQEIAEFGTTASNSGDEEKGRIHLDESDRSFGGNRWPRQETLALLKIRSDMDAVFRDSNPKGPLWEDVSRKLGELGFHRSAKKCKEKFENVYKYHKRTKEGRTGRSESKNYKFFEQLQALENLHSLQHSPPQKPQTPMGTSTPAAALPWTTTHAPAAAVVPIVNSVQRMQTINPTNSTVPVNSTINPTTVNTTSVPSLFQNNVGQGNVVFSTSSSSSSTASEESGGGSNKRKRKWKQFFKRLTKEVIEKQEEMQRKFLEAIEKQENQKMAREDAWRSQETARINREHEVLVQERSTAVAKDAAVIAFLQKLSGQQNVSFNVPSMEKLPPSPYQAAFQSQPVSVSHQQALQMQTIPPPVQVAAVPPQSVPPQQALQLQTIPPPVQVAAAPPQPVPPHQALQLQTTPPVQVGPHQLPNVHNGSNTMEKLQPSPSRWPKTEVEALIKLRTSLDTKYQDGPKAPLWEEISLAMRRMGYNRNAKRCKEKWENINKYFKKVKESSKKRPEDSKTCPYFHQLDAIYREKGKNDISNMVPLMVQPEQQWPPREDIGNNLNLDHDAMQEGEEEDEGETDHEEEDGGYEMVVNKTN